MLAESASRDCGGHGENSRSKCGSGGWPGPHIFWALGWGLRPQALGFAKFTLNQSRSEQVFIEIRLFFA
jgi:hypothetical protein